MGINKLLNLILVGILLVIVMKCYFRIENSYCGYKLNRVI